MSSIAEKITNTRLRQLIQEVFDNPENGTPDNISQSGCVALAKHGYEAWNAWRKAYPEEDVSDNYSVELFKTNSKNSVNFKNTKLENVDFSHFIFGKKCVFEKVEFSNRVSFKNATFEEVDFNSISFDGDVEFSGAKFRLNALFSNVEFKKISKFDGVAFCNDVKFENINFLLSVNFEVAVFAVKSGFKNVSFHADVNLEGGEWGFFEGISKNSNNSSLLSNLKNHGLAPHYFQQIEFLGCEFKGEVNFSNRIFKNSCTFGSIPNSNTSDSSKVKKTIFAKAPKFHNCELHQDTSFDGAEFPEATGKEESARAYRTLKLAFNKMQGVREEQKFFKLEMAEEAKRATCWRRFLFSAYKNLSDYGFSIGLPILYLILSSIIFASVYRLLSCYAQWSIGSSCEFNPRFLEFVILQPLPLPGLEKLIESLKSEIFLISNYESVGIFVVNSWLNVTITILTILQKSLSLLFFFLIGLALKNQFKFK